MKFPELSIVSTIFFPDGFDAAPGALVKAV